ncbi:MAG: hypothetical protein J1E35_01155 [Lachnospiraceae bacterium]|nr:hypothetical protein [Lachnospiraceae bacterium]
MSKQTRQIRQWQAGFEAALKEALLRYRDNMLAQAEPEEGELFPVSKEFFRKNRALGSVSAAMERRRKYYERKAVLLKSVAKAAAVLLIFFITGIKELPLQMPKTVPASSGSFIIAWFSDHVCISFNPATKEELASMEIREPEEFELGYIPDGFELWMEDLTPGRCVYEYRDGDGCVLSLSVHRRKGTLSNKIVRSRTINMDNEHTEFHMIMDGSVELIVAGPLGEEEPEFLLWTQNNCEFMLSLYTEQEHGLDIFDIYRSLRVKNDEK